MFESNGEWYKDSDEESNWFAGCSELNNIDLTIPEIKYCTDNAAMIAAAGYYSYIEGRRADMCYKSKSNDKLN